MTRTVTETRYHDYWEKDYDIVRLTQIKFLWFWITIKTEIK